VIRAYSRGRLERELVWCAQQILVPFGKDSNLRSWGLDLASRGKAAVKKKSVIAVARKLAVQQHRLWVTGEVYDPLRMANRRTAPRAQTPGGAKGALRPPGGPDAHPRSPKGFGGWKGVRQRPTGPLELYELSADPAEAHDVALQHPSIVSHIEDLMRDMRTPSQYFPLTGE